jgi:hypothetical protein
VFHAEEWLDRRDAPKILDPLLSAVEISDVRPITAAVDVVAFNSYTEDERRYLTGALWGGKRLKWVLTSGSPNRPFFVPFTWVVGESLGCVRKHGERLHYCFDRNETLYGYMRDLYTAWRDYEGPARVDNDLGRRMGGIDKGSREDHSALQAADLLAYVSYHLALHEWRNTTVSVGVAHCINRFGRFPRRPLLKPIDKSVLDEWLRPLPTAVRDGSARLMRSEKQKPSL